MLTAFCSIVSCAVAANARPWSTSTGGRLITVVDAPGIALSDGVNNIVTVLNDKGEVALVKKFDSQTAVVNYSQKRGFATAPLDISADYSSIWKETARYPQVKGQHGGMIRRWSNNVIVETKKAVFAHRRFENWCGIAVNSTGDKIIVTEQPMNAPIYRTFVFTLDSWVELADPITPEVPGFGFAGVMAGLNDIEFLGDSMVLFVGGFWTATKPLPGAFDVKTFEKDLIDPVPIRIAAGPRASSGYIYALDLKRRLTTPILKLSIYGGIDPFGGSVTGRVSVSFDNKWLYVLGSDGIHRYDVSKLCK